MTTVDTRVMGKGTKGRVIMLKKLNWQDWVDMGNRGEMTWR